MCDTHISVVPVALDLVLDLTALTAAAELAGECSGITRPVAADALAQTNGLGNAP
jgi:hypothetical protein